MQVNALKLKGLRDQRGWSQEHLAKAAGLGLRTIQRLEAEASASHETLLCIAAALEVEVSALIVAPSEIAAQPAPTRRRSSIAPDDAPWFVRWPLFGTYTRRAALGLLWFNVGVGVAFTVAEHYAFTFSFALGTGFIWGAIHWMDFHDCWGPAPTKSGELQS